MKKDFDQRMKAREPQIKVGARVLLKVERKVKSDPAWDPTPYTVIVNKGTMITAKKGEKQVTRNVSFFKRYHDSGEQYDFETRSQTTSQITTLPSPHLPLELPDLAPHEQVEPLEHPEPPAQVPAQQHNHLELPAQAQAQ